MAEGLLEGVLGGEEEKIDPTVGGTGAHRCGGRRQRRQSEPRSRG